jgi:hypothetical protein
MSQIGNYGQSRHGQLVQLSYWMMMSQQNSDHLNYENMDSVLKWPSASWLFRLDHKDATTLTIQIKFIALLAEMTPKIQNRNGGKSQSSVDFKRHARASRRCLNCIST